MNVKKFDEVSAGFILYRKRELNSTFEYLILQSSKNPTNWTPPKVYLFFFNFLKAKFKNLTAVPVVLQKNLIL